MYFHHVVFITSTNTYLLINMSYTCLLSKRIWYPTVWPIFSPLSADTLSAILNAAILLGWVHSMRHLLLFAVLSSRIIWGICYNEIRIAKLCLYLLVIFTVTTWKSYSIMTTQNDSPKKTICTCTQLIIFMYSSEANFSQFLVYNCWTNLTFQKK